MSITINGTTGIAGVDGTATAPAFQGNDTNTGIFYGTDIVGVSTGGSERMRVDASGNVGIGKSPLNESNRTYLQVYNATEPVITVSNSTMGSNFAGIRAFSSDFYIDNANNGALIFRNQTGYTERMRIDSSGNVGIGTTSPNSKTEIVGRLSLTDGGGASRYALNLESNNSGVGYTGINAYNYATSSGTKLILNESGGEVYIAGITDRGAYNLQCNGTGVWGAGAYVNGSDARIKDDIQPISSSLDVVNKLNPVTFKYKEDWSKDQSVQTGFIAQELQETLKDEIYLEGIVNTGGEYLSVAYQNIIPLLTKSIQELKAIVDAQQQEINELKANNV